MQEEQTVEWSEVDYGQAAFHVATFGRLEPVEAEAPAQAAETTETVCCGPYALAPLFRCWSQVLACGRAAG